MTTWTPEQIRENNAKVARDAQAALKASKTRVSMLPTNERMALAEASKVKPVRKLNEERPRKPSIGAQEPDVAVLEPKSTQDSAKAVRSMNLTERRYAIILNAKKQHNEVLDFRYEGIRLRWGGCMNYTPDFILFMPDNTIRLIEVKGAHIRDRDIVRYKGCRHEWGMFEFEMWQYKKGAWEQKY